LTGVENPMICVAFTEFALRMNFQCNGKLGSQFIPSPVPPVYGRRINSIRQMENGFRFGTRINTSGSFLGKNASAHVRRHPDVLPECFNSEK